MHPVADPTRWYAIRMATLLGPARAARRLRVGVADLARVCAGWPVARRIEVAIEVARSRDT